MNRTSKAKSLVCIWPSLGILSVLGFLLVIFVIATGIAANDYCRFSGELYTTQGLNKYNIAIPGETTDYINQCINGDGNLANFTGINQALLWAQEMRVEYNTLLTFNLSYSYITNLTAVTANQNAVIHN